MNRSFLISENMPIFAGKPPIGLHLMDTRKWHISNNVFVRYNVQLSTA